MLKHVIGLPAAKAFGAPRAMLKQMRLRRQVNIELRLGESSIGERDPPIELIPRRAGCLVSVGVPRLFFRFRNLTCRMSPSLLRENPHFPLAFPCSGGPRPSLGNTKKARWGFPNGLLNPNDNWARVTSTFWSLARSNRSGPCCHPQRTIALHRSHRP